MNCEIPLSEPTLRHENFGPYRTDYHIYRAGQGQNYRLMTEGMLTSVNLSDDRDTVLLSGKDWLHYLERRIYPFDAATYLAGGWRGWPVGWPHHNGDRQSNINARREKKDNPVEVRQIVEDILDDMQQMLIPPLPGGVPADTLAGRGQLGIIFNNVNTGTTTKYRIYPGDGTSVYEHIQKLSEQVKGFEFDILPVSREFKMWSPFRMQMNPVYTFRGQTTTGTETSGAFTHVDWTNDGPDGTFLVGLGSGNQRAGATWYYRPAIDKYRLLEKVTDFGAMENPDLIFQMLKDQNDIYPQTKLSLTLLNPEFLSPSFYTSDRPRSVIGQRVRVIHNFPPYWALDTDYRVNALNWSVDQSSNEEVEFELEVIYEDDPITGGFSGT